MKNQNQSTIDEAISTVGEIANEVGDAVAEVVDNVAHAALDLAEAVSEVEETVGAVSEVASSAPSLKDVMKAIVKDARVGHFIVDILTGKSVKEASNAHFSDEISEGQSSLETLVEEAEQRGYLRGRNEQIEVSMRDSLTPLSPGSQPGHRESSILNHIRRSVWEE